MRPNRVSHLESNQNTVLAEPNHLSPRRCPRPSLFPLIILDVHRELACDAAASLVVTEAFPYSGTRQFITLRGFCSSSTDWSLS